MKGFAVQLAKDAVRDLVKDQLVIPKNALSTRFASITGKITQFLQTKCPICSDPRFLQSGVIAVEVLIAHHIMTHSTELQTGCAILDERIQRFHRYLDHVVTNNLEPVLKKLEEAASETNDVSYCRIMDWVEELTVKLREECRILEEQYPTLLNEIERFMEENRSVSLKSTALTGGAVVLGAVGFHLGFTVFAALQVLPIVFGLHEYHNANEREKNLTDARDVLRTGTNNVLDSVYSGMSAATKTVTGDDRFSRCRAAHGSGLLPEIWVTRCIVVTLVGLMIYLAVRRYRFRFR